MRVAAICVLLVLGAVSRADDGADKESAEGVLEGFCEDGTTIQAGPLHERSGLEEMRARLAEAHEKNPGDAALAIRLAVLESRSGHDERARALLAEIAPESSFRALARYDLGVIELRAGHNAEAQTALADAAAVDSDHVEPPLALALAAERLQDAKAAARAFELAEKRSKPPASATYALRAAQLHEKAGELEEALAAYARAAAAERPPTPGVVPALGAETGSSRARVGAARVLLRLGRAADALPELDKALEAREDPELRFKHGLALFLAGKPAEPDVLRLEKSSPELARRLSEIVARKRELK